MLYNYALLLLWLMEYWIYSSCQPTSNKVIFFQIFKTQDGPLSLFLHVISMKGFFLTSPKLGKHIFFYFPPREKLFCAWSNVTVSLSPFSRNSAIEWLSHLPTEPMNTIKTVQKSFFFFPHIALFISPWQCCCRKFPNVSWLYWHMFLESIQF